MRALLMLGAVAVAASCARPAEPAVAGRAEAPRLNLLSADISEIDYEEARGELRFRVRNPHPVPVQLDRVEWQLGVAGVETVNGRTYMGTVPADYQGEVVARVRIPWDSLDTALSANRTRSYLNWRLSGQGVFVTPDGELRRNFEEEGTMPVLHRPEITLRQLRMRSMDRAAQTATVDLVISADNGQIRSLRSQGTTLWISGTKVAEAARGQTYTDVGSMIIPMRIDLAGMRPSTVQALEREGSVVVDLELRGTADTVHGSYPLGIRVRDRVNVVGTPAL